MTPKLALAAVNENCRFVWPWSATSGSLARRAKMVEPRDVQKVIITPLDGPALKQPLPLKLFILA